MWFTHIQRIEIANSMIKYGGSFVKGLGGLYFKADFYNKLKLAYSFNDIFVEYYKKFTKND